MLETVWFLLWVLLWGVYFMLDGFDLGAGAALPFIAKNEDERKTVYDSIGPFWDGNEVWLITAGGVTFAAFPGTYAVMFSSLYTALMLILFGLILRGASLGLRFEVESVWARRAWDRVFFVSSLAVAVLFGAAFANIFKGVPIDGKGVLQGNILTLLNPYALLGGVLFLVYFVTHGLIWLALKAEADLEVRAAAWAKKLWVLLAALAVIFDIATWFATGIWQSYLGSPALLVIPALNVVALLLMGLFVLTGNWRRAWWASSGFILTAAFFGMMGIYPALLPSSLDSAFSMTMANSASSPLTLKIMLGVVLVFVPAVIIYQAWVYNVFGGKAGKDASYEAE